MTELAVIRFVAAAVVGLLLGGGYFALLHRAVTRAAMAGWRTAGLLALRLSLAAGVFWGLAQLGVWSLVGGLAGFLVARLVATRLVAGP